MVTATKRPLHIKAISDQLKIDYAATYRHVSVLKKSKLVEVYEVGRSRVVSPKNEDLIKRILDIAEQVTT
jgi:DNA-binding transcriptional ArsR family regulator